MEHVGTLLADDSAHSERWLTKLWFSAGVGLRTYFELVQQQADGQSSDHNTLRTELLDRSRAVT